MEYDSRKLIASEGMWEEEVVLGCKKKQNVYMRLYI